MSLFLPFNQRPSSSFVQTGVYVIPANKYARVIKVTGELQIDSITTSPIRSSSVTVLSNSQTNFTIPVGVEQIDLSLSVGGSGTDGWNFTISELVYTYNPEEASPTFYPNGAKQTAIIDNFSLTRTSTTTTRFIPGGTSYLVSMSPSIGTNDNGTVNYSLYFDKKVDPFWCNSGTTINGTRYVVELYDIV